MIAKKVLVVALLAATTGMVVAQSTEDPNLKGVKDDSKMSKDMLRDKDTRAAPGVDPSKANERYEQEKKDKDKKDKEKAAQQKKFDKEKEK